MGKKDKARAKAKEAARAAARKQAKRSKRGGSSTITPPDGVDFFKPPEENSITFDILGFEVGKNRALLSDVDPGSQYYKVSYKKHGSVGPEEKHIVCPSTFGKRCPMEEEFAKQKKGDAEYDDIKSLRPSDRDLFLVHNKGKLYLWDVPWWWFGKLLDIEIEEDDSDNLFWFPEDGVSIRATFETDSFGTKATAVRFKDRKNDIDDEILEQATAIDLAACVNETTYEDVERLMHGVGDDDDDDAEDGGEPEEPVEEPDEEPEEPTGEPDNDGEPSCFGDKDEYDEDGDDCEDCDYRKNCKKAIKDAKESKSGKSGKSGKSDKSGKDSKKDKKDKKSNDKCPHGFEFGKDYDEEDECDNCDNAKACEEANKG
jgi:hypothetical protein